MIVRRLIILAGLVAFIAGTSQAQKAEQKLHSPLTTTLMSAALPGLGQVYNKKYWKVPIIYAGIGIIVYAIDFNSKRYNTYRDAYILRTDGDPATIDDFDPAYYIINYSEANLLTLRNYYRRYLEFSILCGALLYILNVIDANVDAHLKEFKVTDDLSLHIQPYQQRVFNDYYSGISFTFTLN